MKTAYYTAKELAGYPGLPTSERGVQIKAARENWPHRPRQGRGGGREYPLDCLPAETRKALAELSDAPALQAGQAEGRRLALVEKTERRIEAQSAETQLASIMQLPPAEKQRDADRTAILRDWEAFRRLSGEAVGASMIAYEVAYNNNKRPAMSDIRTRIKKVSATTLKKWRRDLKRRGHLGACYGNRKGAGKIDSQPALKEFVIGLMTVKPHIKASQAAKAIQARFSENDIDYPSEGRLNAWMNRWKEKNRQVYTAITNPDAWKDEYLTAFGSASENVTYLNQLWEFDGTPADLMLTDGRHHLCGVIDVYSRRARLLVTPTAKATAVAGLLRRSILDWGLPPDDWGLTAKTDNGSDYVGHHMTRVFKNLRINQELCPPFSPWKKPHIERFFRTFSHDMVELLPGYIGHDVAERKGIEARQAFSERLFKKDQIIDVQMSSADLQAFCDEWVNNIYQHAPHDGLGGKTPFQVANEWQEPIRRITNERALDLLLAEAPGNGGVRTVGKKGIRLDNGLYIAPELWSWVGEDVLVLYDPVDFGQVSAYTLGDNPEFICVAKDPSRTGIDRAEVAAKAREMQKKAVQEARAELKKAAKKQDIDHIADEIRAAAAEKAAKIVELPKPSMEFTTPALEAASKAADVLDAPAAPRPTVDDVAFLSARLKKAQEAKQQRDAEAAAEARPETNRQKYLRWKSVDTAIAAGADVSDADRSFHRSFRQTDIYRAEKGMEEDFPEFYQAKQRQ